MAGSRETTNMLSAAGEPQGMQSAQNKKASEVHETESPTKTQRDGVAPAEIGSSSSRITLKIKISKDTGIFEFPPNTRFIDIAVGTPSVEFAVHYSLLQEVPFFRKMLRQCSTAATNFPEILPAAFWIYIQWLTSATIDPSSGWRRVGCAEHPLGEAVRSATVHDTLLSAYALGEIVGDIDFKDIVMDALVIAIIDSGELKKHVVWKFCAFTSGDNTGRTFFIDLLTRVEGAVQFVSANAKNFLDKDFLFDLSAALLERKDGKAAANPPWNDPESCRYHEHVRRKQPCYKAQTPEWIRKQLRDGVKRWVAEENPHTTIQEVNQEPHHEEEDVEMEGPTSSPAEAKKVVPTKRKRKTRWDKGMKRATRKSQPLKTPSKRASRAKNNPEEGLLSPSTSPSTAPINKTSVRHAPPEDAAPDEDDAPPDTSPPPAGLQEAQFLAQHYDVQAATDIPVELPSRATARNKPMTPQEQDSRIEAIKRQLALFRKGGSQVQVDGSGEEEEEMKVDGDDGVEDQDMADAIAAAYESSEESEEE